MVIRLPIVALARAYCAGGVHAQSPDSSPDVLQAIRTGEIIGAAVACRAEDDRLVVIGRRVIHGIRVMATSDADLETARARHEEAVQRGAAMATSRQISCPAALTTPDVLEREPSLT